MPNKTNKEKQIHNIKSTIHIKNNIYYFQKDKSPQKKNNATLNIGRNRWEFFQSGAGGKGASLNFHGSKRDLFYLPTRLFDKIYGRLFLSRKKCQNADSGPLRGCRFATRGAFRPSNFTTGFGKTLLLISATSFLISNIYICTFQINMTLYKHGRNNNNNFSTE